MLAKQFTEAAREEVEYDKKTGKPYRIYHALKTTHGATQLHLFIDIEEATRDQMLVSLQNRREQMVSDGLMLTYDQDHWNSQHPTEEPIQLPLDLTFDIECASTPETTKKSRRRWWRGSGLGRLIFSSSALPLLSLRYLI